MEPEPAAVVVPIAVFDLERPVAIAFVGLCRTLEAGERQDAKSGRAREREKLRLHWELLPGRGWGDVRPYQLERRGSTPPSARRRIFWPSRMAAYVQPAFSRLSYSSWKVGRMLTVAVLVAPC